QRRGHVGPINHSNRPPRKRGRGGTARSKVAVGQFADREPSRFAAGHLARRRGAFPERLGPPTCCGRGPSAVRQRRKTPCSSQNRELLHGQSLGSRTK